MTGRFRVAELVDHGVTVLVDLVEQDNRLHYEITGPGYVARLPQCGCDLPGCASDGTWRKRCKEAGSSWDHKNKTCHGTWDGWHEEHAVALARAVLGSFRVKKYNPKAPQRQEHRDINRGVNQFAPLDGEELVAYLNAGELGWQVRCNSLRCRPTGKSEGVVDTTATTKQAEKAAERHQEWHAQLPIHSRVALDRWIHDHAMVSAPEPAAYEEWGGAKFDRALAIARAERKAGA